jgi:hypothetical protein
MTEGVPEVELDLDAIESEFERPDNDGDALSMPLVGRRIDSPG